MYMYVVLLIYIIYTSMSFLYILLFIFTQYVVTTEGQTLLPQYLGMYRLTVNSAETYWMVMRNVLSSVVKMHIKFDLKGSTVDRQASDKEKVRRYMYMTYIELMFKKVYIHVLSPYETQLYN